MPLWTVYHPPSAFTDSEKAELASKITDIYGAVMPRFYVGIVFQAIEPNNFYIGGKPTGSFVRIVLEHIARSFPNLAASRRFIDLVNSILEPLMAERGYDWEFHIDETPFDYWAINGFYPPKPNTVDEIRWREEDRPSPRTHD